MLIEKLVWTLGFGIFVNLVFCWVFLWFCLFGCFNVLPFYNRGFLSGEAVTSSLHMEQISYYRMLHTFKNVIINFALSRSQYLVVLFSGLSWLLLTSRALLLCRLQFDFTALISHLYWATSQSRWAKQTIEPLHSSLLPFAAQRVRSVRGKHVHDLCSAGQWLCLFDMCLDSEGLPCVEAGAWSGSWRFSKHTVDMLVHISVSCCFLIALTWCDGCVHDALARVVTPSCCKCEKLWAERENA